MRIGINTRMSAGGGRPVTVDEIIEQVAEIARQGFATAAFAQILGLDALTIIALAGRVVPRIELESAVTPIITEAARKAGRPAPRIIAALPISVTDDPDGARERATRALGFYGQIPSYRAMLDREGAAGPADVMIVGSESEVERQLAELEDAGATDFTASVIGSRDEQPRTFDLLRSWVAHTRSHPV